MKQGPSLSIKDQGYRQYLSETVSVHFLTHTNMSSLIVLKIFVCQCLVVRCDENNLERVNKIGSNGLVIVHILCLGIDFLYGHCKTASFRTYTYPTFTMINLR